jgi:hypothetical protein
LCHVLIEVLFNEYAKHTSAASIMACSRAAPSCICKGFAGTMAATTTSNSLSSTRSGADRASPSKTIPALA